MEMIRDIIKVRSMCCILMEQGEKYWLRTVDLIDTEYHSGQEVELEQFEKFVLLHQYPQALNVAVSMLARRPCSQNEIRKKLILRHYMLQTIEMVLYKLSREHLLNDEDFSEQWVRYRAGQKYGKYRIYQELKRKGVSEENAHAALEQLDENESIFHAKDLAIKFLLRQNASADFRKQKQKVIQALVRRGYQWETAKSAFEQAMHELHNSSDKQEDDD